MYFVKKILIIAILCGIGYALLGYHYIIIDNSVKILKKSELTLEYTIFSIKGKPVETILKVKKLWDDGIGDLLLKEGKISAEQLEMFKEQLEEEK